MSGSPLLGKRGISMGSEGPEGGGKHDFTCTPLTPISTLLSSEGGPKADSLRRSIDTVQGVPTLLAYVWVDWVGL